VCVNKSSSTIRMLSNFNMKSHLPAAAPNDLMAAAFYALNCLYFAADTTVTSHPVEQGRRAVKSTLFTLALAPPPHTLANRPEVLDTHNGFLLLLVSSVRADRRRPATDHYRRRRRRRRPPPPPSARGCMMRAHTRHHSLLSLLRPRGRGGLLVDVDARLIPSLPFFLWRRRLQERTNDAVGAHPRKRDCTESVPSPSEVRARSFRPTRIVLSPILPCQ